MKKIFFLLALLIFIPACNFDHIPPRFEYYHPANQNRANLLKIAVGMTKNQVREIMGEPHQGEGIFKRSPNIWWYYTTTTWRDGAVTQEECTPLCFDSKTQTLVGWGYEYYNKNIQFGDWKSKSYVFDDDTDE